MSGAAGRTRREILADASKAAAALSVAGLGGCFPDVGGKWPRVAAQCLADDSPAAPAGASTVVEVRREDSVVETVSPVTGAKTSTIQPAVVQAMLDAGLSTLAGGADNPWSVLLPGFVTGQRIGLKVNCLNGRLPTSRAVVRALIASLRDRLGVDPTTIVVWDRRLDELHNAGKYTEDDLAGAQLVGTYNTTKPEDGGPGYSEAICGLVEGRTPRLSRILTELTDLTINCPVLKTHNVTGVTAAMKNIYGVIDIPAEYHGLRAQTALPALYRLPPIRNSIRLAVVDALRAVTTGDTADPPDSTPGRLLLASDPVALDAYALALVNRLRAEHPRPLLPVASEVTAWIDNARQAGLGTREYTLIEA